MAVSWLPVSKVTCGSRGLELPAELTVFSESASYGLGPGVVSFSVEGMSASSQKHDAWPWP